MNYGPATTLADRDDPCYKAGGWNADLAGPHYMFKDKLYFIDVARWHGDTSSRPRHSLVSCSVIKIQTDAKTFRVPSDGKRSPPFIANCSNMSNFSVCDC